METVILHILPPSLECLERVLLQEQVERARGGFSSALGDAKTLTSAPELELAALVLRSPGSSE
ncbi:hypothetical protein B484DRAFT_398718 [Ochromonadaceae sp. CCMP2298]|nr:hypothetical protein B484DRAFT_398718 [Ochromonadaceae sp. CCMP2298]